MDLGYLSKRDDTMKNLTLDLNYEGFEEYLLERRIRDFGGGVQYIFRFPNGYGASVIKGLYTFGYENDMWELAVIKFDEDSNDFGLVYDTEITNDVEGYLSDKGVCRYLQLIKKLASEEK